MTTRLADRIVFNVACRHHRRGARRRETLPLEDVLPSLDENGRFAGRVTD